MKQEKLSEDITIVLGDCLEYMPTMAEKSIDLVLTDPPYNLEIDQKKYTGVYATKGKHLDVIKESFGNRFEPTEFLKKTIRISKNGVIVWHSKNLIKTYVDFAEMNNYKWNLMFWHKSNPIPAHFNHQLNDTEYCIRIYPSGAYFNNELKYNDYFTYYILPVQADDEHPTPKPFSIMYKQINVFSKRDYVILDPFMGSGTTGVACAQLGRKFIGVEIEPKYYEIAKKRISNELSQGKLFL